MSIATENLTVGQWAEKSLRAVLVLEKYGIDHHADEAFTLEEACQKRGLDAAKVQFELLQATTTRSDSERDWNAVPVDELIRHIIARHHEYLKLELPRLQARLRKMSSKHGERDGGLLNMLFTVFSDLQDDLDMHLHKEEAILFPFIERYARAAAGTEVPAPPPFGTIANPIAVMEHDHINVDKLLARIREITREYAIPDYACPNFKGVWHSLQELEADLKEHIRLENDFLHPRAKELERTLFA